MRSAAVSARAKSNSVRMSLYAKRGGFCKSEIEFDEDVALREARR